MSQVDKTADVNDTEPPEGASGQRQRAQIREAALREILQVISRSRDDEKPVFEAILKTAAELCNAPFACLFLANADRTHLSIPAFHGTNARFVELINKDPLPLDPELAVTARAMVEKLPLQVADFRDDPLYRSGQPHRVHAVEVEGVRTVLAVPMLNRDEAIGVIFLYRKEVAPFGDDEIALLETFAAQAVIAIENVRQFQELQARFEREAATAEVLDVISRSRDDEQPVFDAIVERAARLCQAPQAGLILANEERSHARHVAGWGQRLKLLETGAAEWPLDSPLAITRSIRECIAINIPDVANDELYFQRHPERVQVAEEEGIRSTLAVPLIRNGEAIGCIDIYRHEVRLFTDDEKKLLETFADQAVIAIENVRQFRELQSRLEREAATREILQVISRSRDDEQPVFKAILENAQKLCGAPFGNLNMVTEDGKRLEIMADGLEAFEPFRPGWSWPVDSQLLVARAVRECEVFHLEDAAQDPLFTSGDEDRVTVVNAGVRSVLTVPLVSEGQGIGSMGLYRRDKRPFTSDEIALVESFAAQAVIAIENVRQFKALEARTEEVQVLNASLESRVEEQVGEIERMGRLKRFLSPAVADAVVSSGNETLLKSHRALIATLFCDIRGFTAFCETAEPEETIEVLQTYHEEMGKLLSEHGAGVDHRMGDGIMVIFNDPLPCDDPAGDALRLGLAMRNRMAELGRQWRKLGHRLGFGVGISLGYATVGMVGSEGRFEYTANGTAVNLAARLCDQAEDGEILLSPRAYIAVEDLVEAESAGELSLKGIKAPVEVYRVTGLTAPA